jgi:dienelactone hydrolase
MLIPKLSYSFYCVAIITIFLLTGCASSVKYVRFPSAAEGSPHNVRAYEYKPEGEGPFPSVVVMHAGAGITDNHHYWAKQLRKWGYVAFLVDTYGARAYSHVDEVGAYEESADQISDAHGAFRYLSNLPYVDENRIGIIGFSRGGATVINVMEEPGYFQSILILIDERDEDLWNCQRVAENSNPEGYPASIIVYPNALHVYDRPIGFNKDAFDDTKKQMNQFF